MLREKDISIEIKSQGYEFQEWRDQNVPVHPAEADSQEEKGGELMATVTKIPATVSRFTAAPIAVKQKRKVAAYARVSTDHED